jgi:NMD protein affecting ribosome stability and mRNA decay
MEVNYCPSCGKKVSQEQNFCANCGANLRRFKGYTGDFKSQLEAMMRDLLENNAEALQELAEKVARGEAFGKGLFFSVEMRDGKPIIKSGDIEDFEEFIKNAPVPSFVKKMMRREQSVEFKEAEVSVSEYNRRKEISIRMPGLKSLDDVEIKKNADILEVAGKAGKTIYFAQVPLEGGVVVNTRLVDGNVKVDIERA